MNPIMNLCVCVWVADEMHETGLPEKGTYGKPTWFENVRSEYWACRQGVCLIDMSTFTKFELRVRSRSCYFEALLSTIAYSVV